MTFNILHGMSPRDGVVEPGRLAELIEATRPDVLALQEVDRWHQRSGDVDFTAVAAAAMGARDSRFAATVLGAPNAVWTGRTGAAQPQAAEYGIALLSTLPVAGWQVTKLPRLGVRVPVRSTVDGRVFIAHDEPRVAITAQLGEPGTLAVTATHLSFIPAWNRRQLRRLMQVISATPGPHVVMGDLNMSTAAAARVSGWRSLVSAPTFPVGDPTRQLDYVLTNSDLSVAAARAMPARLSDHLALVVDVVGDCVPGLVEEVSRSRSSAPQAHA
ncbi:MAG TPA: endonuclease/exonuclease/phosphatase family protein [Mycobacteriales bacterium]|nr:endonuclease/exonuclease/phosphatase family protein [Mycobacteriales bacterium]